MPTPHLVDRFTDATERKRALEAELREAKDELVAVEAALLEEFLAERVTSVKTDAGQTVYSHTSTLVGGDTALLHSLFSDNGLLELVTISHPKLRAWYQEHEREGTLATIPESIRGALKVEKRTGLRVRGS